MAARPSTTGNPDSDRTKSKSTERAANPPDVNALSFEDAMSELESMIERIESGEIGLEQSLEEYERGIALFRRCQQVLNQAEQRFEKLKLGEPEDAP